MAQLWREPVFQEPEESLEVRVQEQGVVEPVRTPLLQVVDLLDERPLDELVLLEQLRQVLEPRLHEEVEQPLEQEVGEHEPQQQAEQQPPLRVRVSEPLQDARLQPPLLVLPQELQVVRRDRQPVGREKLLDVVPQHLEEHPEELKQLFVVSLPERCLEEPVDWREQHRLHRPPSWLLRAPSLE